MPRIVVVSVDLFLAQKVVFRTNEIDDHKTIVFFSQSLNCAQNDLTAQHLGLTLGPEKPNFLLLGLKNEKSSHLNVSCANILVPLSKHSKK